MFVKIQPRSYMYYLLFLPINRSINRLAYFFFLNRQYSLCTKWHSHEKEMRLNEKRWGLPLTKLIYEKLRAHFKYAGELVTNTTRDWRNEGVQWHFIHVSVGLVRWISESGDPTFYKQHFQLDTRDTSIAYTRISRQYRIITMCKVDYFHTLF